MDRQVAAAPEGAQRHKALRALKRPESQVLPPVPPPLLRRPEAHRARQEPPCADQAAGAAAPAQGSSRNRDHK